MYENDFKELAYLAYQLIAGESCEDDVYRILHTHKFIDENDEWIEEDD